MYLRDLLYHLRRNILRDWSDRVDSVSDDDRLWSDQSLVDWINEAQRRLARKTLILRDAAPSDKTRVVLRSGVSQYTLDPDVFAVISARYGADERDMTRIGHDEFNRTPSTAWSWYDPRWSATLPAGRPMIYEMEETLASDAGETHVAPVMRIYPTPNGDVAGTTIALRIARAPRRLTLDDLDMSCEIPEDYQIEMLSWAAYRALSIVDMDQGAPERAQAFRAQFDIMCREARRETARKMFAGNKWRFRAGAYTR